MLPILFAVTKVFVVADKKYETIILPIFGVPAPFHISTIKVRIASLSDEVLQDPTRTGKPGGKYYHKVMKIFLIASL